MKNDQQKFYKRRRLGPLLVEAAEHEHAYGAAHAFLGGTGAVGGAALLQMLALYEEMFALHGPSPDQVPVLLATGRSEDDVSAFTARLFRVIESKYGDRSRPTRIRSSYLTHSGILVSLDRFSVTLLPQLEGTQYLPSGERRLAVESAVEAVRKQVNQEESSLRGMLSRFILSIKPFSSYLDAYAKRHLGAYGHRFLSVTLGIPLPSVVAYHHGALDLIASITGSLSEHELAELKDEFVIALRNDLVQVRENLTERLLIAHTTGVGGMYDEFNEGGRRRTSVRLGFAHAAQDEFLVEKHHFANKLAQHYAESGLLVLITAAAIGVDEVKINSRIPLHQKLVRQLFDLPRELFPGSKATMHPESKAAKAAGRPVPARQSVRIYQPKTVPLLSPPRAEELIFDSGSELRPRFAIRSGENGFFSVANAESLYRTMRVASASELGALLAVVGLLGDDPNFPWFPDNICYYTETDNSRQVFDFLRLPPLLECQISGLEPMALQDLGSSKHQGELHYLALLILLHRLRTLDMDAIDPYVNPQQFDVTRFFVDHSRPLTFEDVDTWDIQAISRDLVTLVSAASWQDLLLLKASPSRLGLFPQRDNVVQKLFERVLASVWAITSLGTPIVFSSNGETIVSAGYFVAPLDIISSSSASMYDYLHDDYKRVRQSCSFLEFVQFHLCDRGFVDLRPHAVLSTAKSVKEPLEKKISVSHSEEELTELLRKVPPYSYFSTCGLLAVTFRLRSLYRLLREAVVELGTYPEFRWQMPRDDRGHILVIPGVCEAFRMVAEGLEKSTGLERIDGVWGYGQVVDLERRKKILKNMQVGL